MNKAGTLIVSANTSIGCANTLIAKVNYRLWAIIPALTKLTTQL